MKPNNLPAKQNKTEQFILMRLNGKSYGECAEALQVPETELVQLAIDIDLPNKLTKGRLLRYETLIRQSNLHNEARVTSLIKILANAETELLKRDFTDLTTDKLINTMQVLSDTLQKVLPTVEHTTGGYDFIDGNSKTVTIRATD